MRFRHMVLFSALAFVVGCHAPTGVQTADSESGAQPVGPDDIVLKVPGMH